MKERIFTSLAEKDINKSWDTNITKNKKQKQLYSKELINCFLNADHDQVFIKPWVVLLQVSLNVCICWKFIWNTYWHAISAGLVNIKGREDLPIVCFINKALLVLSHPNPFPPNTKLFILWSDTEFLPVCHSYYLLPSVLSHFFC